MFMPLSSASFGTCSRSVDSGFQVLWPGLSGYYAGAKKAFDQDKSGPRSFSFPPDDAISSDLSLSLFK